MNTIMDLYTDYLLSSFGQVTATGLSDLLDGSLSHDKVTRTLSRLFVRFEGFVARDKTLDSEV